MIFGEGKSEEEIKLPHAESETAIFPLAVPSIASSVAMLAAVCKPGYGLNTCVSNYSQLLKVL
jgi:small neutral amino acid transporter SnatA (MarC family)